MKPWIGKSGRTALRAGGLLALRLGTAGLLVGLHGARKLDMIGGIGDDGFDFPDPLGIGPGASLVLAAGAEVVGAGLIALGLLTRAGAASVLVMMLVAAFVVHGGDPLAVKEKALLYAIPALALILTGPGPLSLDHFVWRSKKKKKGSEAGPGD